MQFGQHGQGGVDPNAMTEAVQRRVAQRGSQGQQGTQPGQSGQGNKGQGGGGTLST